MIIFYILVFLSVYVQMFFIITYFENRDKIIIRDGEVKLKDYPSVTVIVPCWNEENTVLGTVRSLLALKYPKDKLKIFLIDDGSTDGTWNVLKKFENFPNIRIFHKENGGKHTALNLGLEKLETEYVGCLDADSFVDKYALVRLMSYFERDPSAMAVSPSIIVNNPKSIIQKAQKAEYDMAVYVKKMLGFLGAIHVTPGPLTVFRKKVFDDLGPYRHAHNTEDMEIAYRMQKHDYKIEQCNDAFIYTNTPPTIKKLYKQRLRWLFGFINNTIDYRALLMKKKYGNFAMFTVPAGVVSIFAATFLFVKIFYSFGQYIYQKFVVFQISGVQAIFVNKSFDPFYINTQVFVFVSIFLYGMIFISMIIGRKMGRNKNALSISMLYYFLIYSVIAPFWLMKAVYNTAVSKKPAWR